MATQEMTLDDRFALLADSERQLVHKIAQGMGDEDLSKNYNVEVSVFYGAINQIARTLNVRGEDYETRRRLVKESGQRFFKIKPNDEVSSRSTPAMIPSRDSDDDSERILPEADDSRETLRESSDQEDGTEEVVQTSATAVTSDELPELGVLVENIKKLKHKQRIRLEAVIAAKKGDRTTVARDMGLEPASLSAVMFTVYREIGVPNVPGRKKHIAKALELIRKENLNAQATVPSAVPPPAPSQEVTDKAEKVLEPDSASNEGSVSLEPEEVSEPRQEILPPVSEPVREDEQVPAPKYTDSALHSKPNGFGAGVVIPLPSDTVGIDVLSGEFRNKEPSREFAQGMKAKRAQGLKPAFVVLFPSSDDPTLARGHVVFVERERK
ncbi:MAG TPA: hypothetical protein VHD31_01830 [Candidatus Paceibacterota bacterium]|nr:hypothetical protein [Candidatus Paceibacterota bacterium]